MLSYCHSIAWMACVGVAAWNLSLTWVGIAQTCCAQQPELQLVWEDDFDGPGLDFSKWECEVNAFGGGNNELQLYTDRTENVRVVDGVLIIEARADKPSISGTERLYSSGRVRTKHRGDWCYGRFEVSAKLPVGQGVWPAIWMMPTQDKYGSWAASGEIDIMEYRGQTSNEVLGTLHFGGSWPNNQYAPKPASPYRLPQGTFADGFHRFVLEWEKGVMRWYVDDVLVQTIDRWESSGGAFPAPFDKLFHLILNIAVGGGFVGDVGSGTKFPQQMQVDYVRVYQRPVR